MSLMFVMSPLRSKGNASILCIYFVSDELLMRI